MGAIGPDVWPKTENASDPKAATSEPVRTFKFARVAPQPGQPSEVWPARRLP